MAPKYIIEHMEEGVSDWVRLEYLQIVRDVGSDNLWLAGVKPGLEMPKEFVEAGVQHTTKDVLEFGQLDPNFDKSRVCLLDPSATEEFSPEDRDRFDYFLFGGILGDHPPRDRTGELRNKGFVGRRLGPIQMTTDTAVRVTKMICDQQKKLDDIDFVDFPELKFNKNESTEMPFRYVKDSQGRPIMPQGMFELIKADSQKSLDDLL
uniref:ARAD1A17776p n=1 Tax=Blastobotrys adeninivorans TaxID=409370 RepID=A0A060SYL2_BLAAD